MLTNVLVDLQILPDQLNLGVGVLHQRCETLLNALHLLRYGTEDTLLKSIELVEATPCSDLTQTNENTAHGLEVECLVTTEYQHEATKLYTKGLD